MKTPLLFILASTVVLVSAGRAIAQNQWDDKTFSQPGEALVVLGIKSPTTGRVNIGRDQIPLDDFERASASASTSPAEKDPQVQNNAAQIRNNTAAIGGLEGFRRRMQAQIEQNRLAIEEQQRRTTALQRQMREAAALNGALDFQRPLDGKRVRFSVGTATFDEEWAVGLGATAVIRNLDVSVGVAVSAHETLGKGGVGVSF